MGFEKTEPQTVKFSVHTVNNNEEQLVEMRSELRAFCQEQLDYLSDFPNIEPDQPLCQVLLQIIHAPEPEKIKLPSLMPILTQITTTRHHIYRQVTTLEKDVQLTESQVIEAQTEIEHLQESPEYIEPETKKALQILDSHGIEATPLYQNLTAQTALRLRNLSEFEHFIGDEILNTLVVNTEAFEDAKAIIFTQKLFIRLTHPGLQAKTVPAWLTQYLDDSSSLGIGLLATAIGSCDEPVLDRNNGYPTVDFRGHSRRISKECARFIGHEQRCRERDNQLRNLKQALSLHKSTQRRIKRSLSEKQVLLDRLSDLEELLWFLCQNVLEKSCQLHIARQQ